MNRFKQIIPNSLTSANLICGCIGIVMSFNDQLIWAAAMIWISGVFDFLDGFSARLLNVSSDIGKQLDSLADMVTFGVLPSVLVFQLLRSHVVSDFSLFEEFIPYFAFIIAVFSAVRLAKFNIDTRQSDSFIGIPTPANAICISAFPYILAQYHFSNLSISLTLIIYSATISWLMIAEISMLALKFKTFSWSRNEAKWIFIVTSITLVLILQIIAIPFVIISYIIVSILNNVYTKEKEQIE